MKSTVLSKIRSRLGIKVSKREDIAGMIGASLGLLTFVLVVIWFLTVPPQLASDYIRNILKKG